jgi:hypothetical protein
MAGDLDRHTTTATAADANVRTLQLQVVTLQAQAAQQEQEVQRLQVWLRQSQAPYSPPGPRSLLCMLPRPPMCAAACARTYPPAPGTTSACGSCSRPPRTYPPAALTRHPAPPQEVLGSAEAAAQSSRAREGEARAQAREYSERVRLAETLRDELEHESCELRLQQEIWQKQVGAAGRRLRRRLRLEQPWLRAAGGRP